MMTNIAIVGAGVIGASWATQFLAHGLNVSVTAPAPGAESQLRDLISAQWRTVDHLGRPSASPMNRLRFTTNLQDAVANADFVQECGPERLEIKRAIFEQLDKFTRPDVPLVSSSSGLTASEIQCACRHPERVLIGHPFNPSHLIPLVEVVGGTRTSSVAIETTLTFYKRIGKTPVHVKKEVKGHLANRLQAALWREAYGLVAQGVATVEDIDLSIAHGPGLRWALLGPFVNQQLSGGDGGMEHLLEHLGPPMDDWWQDLCQTRLTEDVKSAVLKGIADETETWDLREVANTRDKLLVKLIALKRSEKNIP